MPDDPRAPAVTAPVQPVETIRRPGETIAFDNGGRIVVAWTNERQIGFATWAPGIDDPILRRMTFEDFEASLQLTRDKIAREATDA